MGFWYLAFLFFAKVLDNMLGTAKIILVQHNRCILAGVALGLSNFIYFNITKDIVAADGNAALIVVSVASGIGCCLAVELSNRLSKDRTHINVIMSDNKPEMCALRDFLALNHITNVANDSYTLDWNTQTITITAYAKTKQESRMIDSYLESRDSKFKRIVQKG